jgi:hypothetical protein
MVKSSEKKKLGKKNCSSWYFFGQFDFEKNPKYIKKFEKLKNNIFYQKKNK